LKALEQPVDDVIEVPGAPDLPGLRFRHYHGEVDLPAIVSVVTAAHREDGVDWFPTVRELANELANPLNEDPARDLVVGELDGRIVAFARASWALRGAEYTYQTDGEVEPSIRRRGIGRALLRAQQDRLRTVAAGHPAEVEKRFQSWVFGGQVGAEALLRSDGYAPIRYFAEMARPLDEPIPSLPLPDGLEMRPVDPVDHRRIFDAEAEAFRDHWGSRDWTDADYGRTVGEPNLDTTLWRVAWDGDQVVGVIVTVVFPAENEALGLKRGWLDRVSVRRPWRRRGVASALIVSALEGLRERGLDTGVLGVDADNPTGAFQLYEGLGFLVVQSGQVLARPL
jgi:mycothiol synthase